MGTTININGQHAVAKTMYRPDSVSGSLTTEEYMRHSNRFATIHQDIQDYFDEYANPKHLNVVENATPSVVRLHKATANALRSTDNMVDFFMNQEQQARIFGEDDESYRLAVDRALQEGILDEKKLRKSVEQIVYRKGPLTVGMIGNSTGIPADITQRIVGELEEAGVVESESRLDTEWYSGSSWWKRILHSYFS